MIEGTSHPATRVAVVVVAIIAGLLAQVAGVMSAGFARTVGEFLLDIWPFVAMALVCWTFAADVEISARLAGRVEPQVNVWTRALAAGAVAVVVWALVFGAAVLLDVDGLPGYVIVFGGWGALSALA